MTCEAERTGAIFSLEPFGVRTFERLECGDTSSATDPYAGNSNVDFPARALAFAK